jgi:hypothetical protein
VDGSAFWNYVLFSDLRENQQELLTKAPGLSGEHCHHVGVMPFFSVDYKVNH